MNDELAKEIRKAIKNDDVDGFLSLIINCEEIIHHDTPFGTWLHVAAKCGNIDIVNHLISIGSDINANGGTFGGAPINLAAGYGHIEVVKTLISAGAKLDVEKPERNALFSAIQGGHFAIVKLLVEKGIDYHVIYNGESMKNMSAYAFARERGQTEIAEYLANLK